MHLGVKRGEVKLLPYSPQWAEAFNEEKENLSNIFGITVLQIEHIGSTAVPGLMAKPLIDMAILIERLQHLAEPIIAELMASSYQERVGRLMGRQRVFAKGDDESITHHLHIIELGEADWEHKLLFRNALIRDEALRKSYHHLKIKLSKDFAQDRARYTAAKANFIREVLENYSRTNSNA